MDIEGRIAGNDGIRDADALITSAHERLQFTSTMHRMATATARLPPALSPATTTRDAVVPSSLACSRALGVSMEAWHGGMGTEVWARGHLGPNEKQAMNGKIQPQRDE